MRHKGVGEKTVRKLLKEFGISELVRGATEDELAAIVARREPSAITAKHGIAGGAGQPLSNVRGSQARTRPECEPRT